MIKKAIALKAPRNIILVSLLVFFYVLVGCSSGTSQTAETTPTDSKEEVEKEQITLRMLESGGTSGDSIEEGYIRPFTEKTGIKIERDNPMSLGKLEAMVKSGQKTYDITTLDGIGNLAQAVEMGLVEKLDWEAINPEPILPNAKHEYGLGFQYVSNVMAWREDMKPLTSWEDFWNVTDFPGRRALLDDPTVAIPAALLGDGVSPDELYPLDLDRAFASLERIKPHINVWWTSGAQPIQLLQDQEVDYSLVWNGRVFGEEGIEYTFNQGLTDIGYFIIPKGEREKGEEYIQAINQFLHEVTIAENQAVAAEIIPYTGPSEKLSDYIPEDRINNYPTSPENYSKQVFTDGDWWATHQEEVQQRWAEFKLNINR